MQKEIVSATAEGANNDHREREGWKEEKEEIEIHRPNRVLFSRGGAYACRVSAIASLQHCLLFVYAANDIRLKAHPHRVVRSLFNMSGIVAFKFDYGGNSLCSRGNECIGV